nr:hypothetical protein [Streptomyces oceani]
MIDRLERRGLARRVPHPTDRRVKLIQPTPEGCVLRDRVTQHTTEHSPFARLDRESGLRLHTLLREVIGRARPPSGSATSRTVTKGSGNERRDRDQHRRSLRSGPGDGTLSGRGRTERPFATTLEEGVRAAVCLDVALSAPRPSMVASSAGPSRTGRRGSRWTPSRSERVAAQSHR